MSEQDKYISAVEQFNFALKEIDQEIEEANKKYKNAGCKEPDYIIAVRERNFLMKWKIRWEYIYKDLMDEIYGIKIKVEEGKK